MMKYTIKILTKGKKTRIQAMHEENLHSLQRGRTISVDSENTESLILNLLDQIPDTRLSSFPAVLFPHQLHSIMRIDEAELHIGLLLKEGKIAKISLPSVRPSIAILHLGKFKSWYAKRRGKDLRMLYFIKEILPKIKNVNFQKAMLTDRFQLSSGDIKDLITSGFIVAGHDGSSYELSFPGAGAFSKAFMQGRQAIVAALSRSPDKELFYHELEARGTVINGVSLGFKYQMADVLGLKIADGINTTEGTLIRFLRDYS